jgi:hypothetical protein
MMQREMIEQIRTVQWFRLQYPHILIAASANGGSRHKLEAINLKRSGLTPGIPDLQIFCARKGFHGLYIEMKAPKTATAQKGRLTPLQQECIDYLNAQGYLARVAWGFEEAKKIVDWYLE